MARTAEGHSIKEGDELWNPHVGIEPGARGYITRVTILEIRGDDVRIGPDLGVSGSSLYLTRENAQGYLDQQYRNRKKQGGRRGK